MGRAKAALALGLTLGVGSLQAAESLSCRVQQDLEGADGAPEVREFIWSTAHGGSEPTGAIKTAIGTIGQGEALGSITLDGQPVQLPTETRGVIRFGTAYDYGDRVVLAYRVERQDDSSATPSEVVYTLDKSRVVADADILPGSQSEAPGHCILVD
ncbi:hypothetical protein LDO32_03810 [Luteimonas sp. Y-2-2-4F]|nr:hypothetical protein [Luteimonas sp. Y-2-2-4F]MCD9030860.1 hypothetical protein [Luteimonas sp. Y-2-2-4F]